jgi:hypothetical protein
MGAPAICGNGQTRGMESQTQRAGVRSNRTLVVTAAACESTEFAQGKSISAQRHRLAGAET